MILPRRLRIEISSFCNLHCSFCTYRREPLNGFMSFELFDRIIRQLEGFADQAEISLFNIGEPLTHPEFSRIVRHISCVFPKRNFTLSTNCTLLDQEKSLAILESGVFRRLYFSIDAADEKTYSKLRCGGDFHQVINNVKISSFCGKNSG